MGENGDKMDDDAVEWKDEVVDVMSLPNSITESMGGNGDSTLTDNTEEAVAAAGGGGAAADDGGGGAGNDDEVNSSNPGLVGEGGRFCKYAAMG
jgi:hypothetical protein